MITPAQHLVHLHCIARGKRSVTLGELIALCLMLKQARRQARPTPPSGKDMLMPYDRSKYPSDWPEISRRIRFERAGNRCEWCGAVNGEPHPVTGGRVTLTTAHIHNPDPADVRDENLAALCNSCHNRHDAPMRARHAAETRRRKKEALQPSLLTVASAPATEETM